VWRGTADGAAIHLLHRSGVYNAPYARALLRGRQPTLIHLWRREQGLLVGAGTRVLLDRMLIDAGIQPHSVQGTESDSHLEVALAVASGVADAGLGVRAAAAALDLNFVPLVSEQYDIALPADALGGYDTRHAGQIKTLPDPPPRCPHAPTSIETTCTCATTPSASCVTSASTPAASSDLGHLHNMPLERRPRGRGRLCSSHMRKLPRSRRNRPNGM
jgi:hypothetical protein